MTGKVIRHNKNGLVFEIETTVFSILKDPDTGLLTYQLEKEGVTEDVSDGELADVLEVMCPDIDHTGSFNKWFVDGMVIYESLGGDSDPLFYRVDDRNFSLATPLSEYIKDHYDNSQRTFADAQGVKPQQVTQWLDAGYIVVDGELYSKRRELK